MGFPFEGGYLQRGADHPFADEGARLGIQIPTHLFHHSPEIGRQEGQGSRAAGFGGGNVIQARFRTSTCPRALQNKALQE